MTPKEFLQEARSMALPSVRLSAEPNGAPVAYWGYAKQYGERVHHLLSLDLRRLVEASLDVPPNVPKTGTAVLLQRADDSLSADFRLVDAPISWPDIPEAPPPVRATPTNPFTGETMGEYVIWRNLDHRAVLLWAHCDVSLPYIDDVLRYGGPRVSEWLKDIGWNPTWGYNGNFPDSAVADEYLSTYQTSLWGDEGRTVPCVARGRTFATIGGWPYPLDGESSRGHLVLTAFASTEPQIEVWSDGGELRTLARIT